MKKSMLLGGLLLLQINPAEAQNYEKVYFNEAGTKTEFYEVTAENAVGTLSEIKFKLKLANLSNEFIHFKPTESHFETKGISIPVTEKDKFLDPGETKSYTINGEAADMNKVNAIDFHLKGLYRIVPGENPLETGELKLPLESNSFTYGSLNFSVAGLGKTSSLTTLKLEVKNTGTQYAIVNPSRVSARMPDGNVYACANKKDKPFVLAPGQSESFSVKWEKMPGGSQNDMQLRDMYVVWDRVFFMASAVPCEEVLIPMTMDEVLTKEKNE